MKSGSIEEISSLIVSTFESMDLADSYASEERDFLPDCIDALTRCFDMAGIDSYSLNGCIGGKDRARIDMLGTNFWPDVEVSVGANWKIAIELKIGRPGITGPLAQTLGQLLIYKLKYPAVVGFMVHPCRGSEKLHEYDEEFHRLCDHLELPLVVRQIGNK